MKHTITKNCYIIYNCKVTLLVSLINTKLLKVKRIFIFV